MHGKPTFLVIKKQMVDGYAPDFAGPDYYQMKKSMHDEYMGAEMDPKSDQLEADPKHKQSIKKLGEVVEGLRKASRTHAEQADVLEGVISTLCRTVPDKKRS